MAANVQVQYAMPSTGVTRQQLIDAIESIVPLESFTDDETVGVSASKLSLKSSVPRWQKFTVTRSQFSAAATTKDVVIFNLPSGGVVHQVKIKHSEAFAGGSISTYTVSVGLATNATKYAGAFDVKQAVTSTAQQLSSPQAIEDHETATAIVAHAASSGANLSVATAGSVDIWILWSAAL